MKDLVEEKERQRKRMWNTFVQEREDMRVMKVDVEKIYLLLWQ